jgi:hypothetical protein
MLISDLPYSSTVKIEVISSSETSIYSQNYMAYIPEDRNLYNQYCENLKSYIMRENGNVSNVGFWENLRKKVKLSL